MSARAEIAANLASVRTRIVAAARRADRDPAAVTLVGASKTVPADVLGAAVGAGLTDLGENRAQELVGKAEALAGPGAPRWHFIGRLQRNKVARLAPWVSCWHTVDREPLGVEIARRAPSARVFVEVNIAREPQKGGCAPDTAGALADALRALELRVDGLMTIPPRGEDPRPHFAALRDLAARIGVVDLSMGMTEDFECAIEEGATIVRVGRALFGSRRPGA
jgi:pyridoxal phosphate enzyme (YggS family)